MKNYLSKIPKQWKNTNAKGIKIGIIDSGFDVENTYIKKYITEYIDYGTVDKDHGTHVMGIMCFNSPQNTLNCGLANRASYYITSIPMGKKNGLQCLVKAASEMLSYQVDVLNMSFTNYKQNESFKNILHQLYKSGTILVGAYSQSILFPHSYPFVISAGNQLIIQNTFNSTISNNRFKVISGTSMQSAFISSVAALAKAYDKKINNNQFLNVVSGQTQYVDKTYVKPKQYSIIIK